MMIINIFADKVCRPGFLVSAARTSFKKLVGRLAAIYPVVGAESNPSPHKERITTTKLLARGLHDVMSSCSLERKFSILPSQVQSCRLMSVCPIHKDSVLCYYVR